MSKNMVDICVKETENVKQDFLMELANGYEIPRKKDVQSDGKESGVTGEPQGNKIRQKFRKFGLKKMEKNYMKEGIILAKSRI